MVKIGSCFAKNDEKKVKRVDVAILIDLTVKK